MTAKGPPCPTCGRPLARTDEEDRRYRAEHAAERAAAHTLGWTTAELRAVALTLWGRPYKEEREARAEPGMTQGSLGYFVSRPMMAELRKHGR